MHRCIPVSTAFRADARGWTAHMLGRLMEPGVVLAEHDRKWVIERRSHFAKHEDAVPGPHAYDRICRIAQSCGVLRARPKTRGAAQAVAAAPPSHATPPRFAVGSPIPRPPPLRRPVALAEPTETWDPAGMPGL